MKSKFLSLCAFLLAFFSPSSPAVPAEIAGHPMYSITVPDGWHAVDQDTTNAASPVVRQTFDAAKKPQNALGWKLSPSGDFQAAFAVDYQAGSVGKLLPLLKKASGEEREKAATQVTDNFAAHLKQSCQNGGLTVLDMSADMMESGGDVVVVIDALTSRDGKRFMRSNTVILHGAGALTVSVMHEEKASPDLVEQLDALPFAVSWK